MTNDPQLSQLGPQIASALGWEYMTKRSGHQEWSVTRHYVYDPEDGLTLDLSWNPSTQPGKPRQIRLGLSPIGPPTLNHDQQKRYRDVYYSSDYLPVINISTQKMPERMAREIKRRLIPDAYELWETIKERADALAKSEAERQATRDRILQYLPDASLVGPDRGTIYVNTRHPGHVYAEMTPYGESVSFQRLSIPADLAVQFAELIHHYRASRANG